MRTTTDQDILRMERDVAQAKRALDESRNVYNRTVGHLMNAKRKLTENTR